MKTKKVRSSKAASKRKKVVSDVTPSTSLPPLVEGQLRCFLRVTVSRVIWTTSKPSTSPTVRLRWWGESSGGTLFRPRDGSRVEPEVKTTARFAIRCGPKQFTSYLTDMGTLVLEVLSKPDHLPMGRVQIPGIARLSLSHPISGFFTLVSPASEKLGELQVSLALEPLIEAYDSSSSIPTTDMSVESPFPAVTSTSKLVSHSDHVVVPPVPHHLPASVGKDVRGGSPANTPIGKDHLYFQEMRNIRKETQSSEIRPREPLGSSRPSSKMSPHQEEHVNPGGAGTSPHRADADHRDSNDVLSVLLDRGNKLRNAMVISAMKSNPDPDLVLKDMPHPVPKENIGALPPVSSIRPSGKLLQDVLGYDPDLSCPQQCLLFPEYLKDNWSPSTENKAVELLLGSLNGSVLPILDGDSLPVELLSGASSVCGDSDLEDPRYDQSLLENLFYSGPMADSSLSDIADEEGGPSTRKTRQKTGVLRTGEKSKKQKVASGKESKSFVPEGPAESLSVDQIAALGRVRTARVEVHSLKVPNESGQAVPLKTPRGGKPPHPLSSRKCTYFVEYCFPVPSATPDGGPVTMATQLTRVASCKVAGGMVNFQKQCTFPVQFNSAVIEHWWNTDLKFTIYSRKGTQTKPVPVGSATFPLRSVLEQGTQHCHAEALPVLGLEGRPEGAQENQELGPLKVSIELDVDKKSLPVSAVTKPALSLPATARQTSVLPEEHADVGLQGPTLGQNLSADSVKKQSRPEGPDEPHPPPSHAPAVTKPTARPQQRSEEEEVGVLLHALLMIPDGRDFSCTPACPSNVYLSCKMFGFDETTRSVVSWGQTHPMFNFIQVVPVILTSKLLERLRNNVMVIEVWQRGGGSGQDRPLGLVKLPLHQFYMSFSEPKVCKLLLQAQYPVVGVDSYMPVLDICTGSSHGLLRVLLAMGLAEQIASLQRMRDVELSSLPHPLRPPHLLDPGPQPESKVEASQAEDMREHVFEVRVERVKGLMPLQSTVWGEADCYVQYTFPTQEKGSAHTTDPHSSESGVVLSRFRTSPTLCVPDPVFSHTHSHVLLAPVAVPVQRLLLGSLSGQSADTRGGIVFEVWCRYYYPNVRDQLVASGMLPLSKLCAMVTMQREEVVGAQVFSLPLVPRTEGTTGHQPQPSGLMDVHVRYLHRPMRVEGVRGGAVASRVVMLTIQIHRAAGLQAAARTAARLDDSLKYYVNVGVNSYVTVEVSFLTERERRSTRVVARSFCPEFEHHAEFPCSLLVYKAQGETRSLAEMLEGAAAIFTLLHRNSRGPAAEGPTARDTVLGTVTVPLADLVHKRTGISGWFALSLPRNTDGHQAHIGAVGGLEVSVGFAHRSDRERVISAARELGWQVDEEEEKDDEEGEIWQERTKTLNVAVSVPRAWLPMCCLLLPGHTDLQRSTYCYIRYKLYDGKAVCSSLQHPFLEEGEAGGVTVATATFGESRPVELRLTPSLRWYLREERLEVQVWVAFGKHKRPRPHDADRLVGSTYIDLFPLASRGQQKLTITGVYPLFRRSASDLSGAAVRVHVYTVVPHQSILDAGAVSDDMPDSQEDEEDGGEEHKGHVSPVPDRVTSRHPTKASGCSDVPSFKEAVLDMENTFAARIVVERATHLSLKGSPLAERTGASPSCCVSYSTADPSSPITTAVVQDSSCPVWNHQQEGRLSKQVLVDPQQTLVFKVWHKGDVERVIGFASVDLSPLLAGFQSVCGWYNITDYSGQCQGQLKVSVSPLEGVQDLQVQTQVAKEDPVKDSPATLQTLPLYCTSALYNSFPAHVSRYPEQKISASPNHVEAIFLGRPVADDRHEEHLANVRLFHHSLKESEEVPHSAVSGESQSSSSALFSALRKNLSELDEIQKYFSRKLSPATFSSLSEQEQRSWLPENRGTDANPTDLLLKSNLLVGGAADLVSSLHGRYPQGSPHVSEEPMLAEDQPLPTAECETLLQSHPPRVPETYHSGGSPSSSPTLAGDEPDTSLLMVEKDHNDEGKIRSSPTEEEVEELEEVEEEEYEETVIEPRPLNEITSLTDKTSPWTSLLSEPDVCSSESLEGPGEQPSQEELQDVLSVMSEEEHLEPSVHQDGDKVCTVDTSAEHEPPGQRAEQTSPLPDSEETGDEDEEEEMPASCSSEHQEAVADPCRSDSVTEAPLSSPLEIPNFFLPVQQLEASMRALHLAPVFPSTTPDTAEKSAEPAISFRRVPRPRPDISSVKKEETKRIAKIFATNFSNRK